MDKKELQRRIHAKTIVSTSTLDPDRVFEQPPDWELYWTNRGVFVSKERLEKQFGCSINFSIQMGRDSITKIDSSADLIIIVAKEDFVPMNQNLFVKACGRPLDQIILLSDVVLENSVFDFTNPKFIYAGSWFDCPVNVLPNVHKPKQFLFDALIGRQHKWIDILWEHLEPFKDKMLYRYLNQVNLEKYDEEVFNKVRMDRSLRQDLLPFDSDEFVTMIHGSIHALEVKQSEWINQFGSKSVGLHHTWISRITPNRIFDNSMCSLVRESDFWFANLYLTEKTAKPLLAKRVFFTLGGYEFNAILKKIGFKPYGECEWDSIKDINKRIETFAKSMSNLNHNKISDLYESKSSDIEHNYKLANQNWAQRCMDFILQTISN